MILSLFLRNPDWFVIINTALIFKHIVNWWRREKSRRSTGSRGIRTPTSWFKGSRIGTQTSRGRSLPTTSISRSCPSTMLSTTQLISKIPTPWICRVSKFPVPSTLSKIHPLKVPSMNSLTATELSSWTPLNTSTNPSRGTTKRESSHTPTPWSGKRATSTM